MGLTPDEKATLDALTAKANEPDAEDFEVEIWNDKGNGTRVPLSKASKWLKEQFGIGDTDEASDDSAGGSGASGGEGGSTGGAAPSGGTPPRSSVFGRK